MRKRGQIEEKRAKEGKRGVQTDVGHLSEESVAHYVADEDKNCLTVDQLFRRRSVHEVEFHREICVQPRKKERVCM
jgi:hypothetical protein